VTRQFIPFLDLRPGDDTAEVRAAIERVVARGWFVLGPEVEAFEAEFAEASGARHAVGVASGTDAIALLLRAAGIGSGDEVIVPAMTAAFTALAVVQTGARPVFADVDPVRLTLDASSLAAAVTARTRAVVPVHLYGQPADLDAIYRVAARHGLAVIEDCCQAHLATCNQKPVGTRGIGGAFSFYPTKNLGALGDGGAIITNDAAVADRVRRLRNGGQTDRYSHVEAGINSRLDEIQAAALRAKLPRLSQLTVRRRELAAAYRRLLPPSVRPIPQFDAGHVYHLFPVRSPERDGLQTHLRAAGIEALIHYPLALPQQEAFKPFAPADCPAAALSACEVLSLPFHPRLDEADVSHVAETVAAFQKGRVLA
jgi:dTDP-3-amino-3,4,6-trideoxy-alpha-D-glucose transaminase